MLQCPRTPSSSSPYNPHTSSPLSEPCFPPSPSTSAAARLQSRRLAQYKSTTTSTPTRRVSSAYRSRTGDAIRATTATSDEPYFAVRLFSSSVGGGDVPGEAENPRSTLLRDRLRQRCVHRAQEARTKRVERERRRSALSSDGEDLSMESDEEDDQEVVINDELFRRIMKSAQHRQRHSYRLSFQNEVGSSLDPNIEDIAEWERKLQDDMPYPLDEPEPELPFSEFDEDEIAELAAQAEEDELWAELDDTHTIFGLSDTNDSRSQATPDDDVDMA